MNSQAVTCIPFIPRAYKVVLECTFEISVLNLTNPDVIKELVPIKTKVVAIGEGISDLNIGDDVLIASTQQLSLVDFKWNNQALKVKQNVHESGHAIIGCGSITAKEYFITDSNNILGVHDHTTQSH